MRLEQFFDLENCQFCGNCLSQCPYISMERKTAEKEIKNLVENGITEHVLQKCRSCFACNFFCPRSCSPYGLILFRWHQRINARGGLPARISYFMPTAFPNFRTDLINALDPEEKNLVKKWEKAEPAGDLVLFPGCNALVLPHILTGNFLEGITISGSWKLCCGEMYYRMGYFQAVKDTARRLTEYFHNKKIGCMLFACPACYNMFSSVLPEEFGAEFPFEKKLLSEYFLEKVNVKRPVEKQIYLHDSCHGRIIGKKATQTSRELLKKLGLEVLEAVDGKGEGSYYCCGAAAGANRFNPIDILITAGKAVEKVRKTGCQEIGVYCGGCQLVFGVYGFIRPASVKAIHLFEYYREAHGEKTYRPAPKRAGGLVKNAIKKVFPGYFSNRQFKVDAQGKREWK